MTGPVAGGMRAAQRHDIEEKELFRQPGGHPGTTVPGDMGRLFPKTGRILYMGNRTRRRGVHKSMTHRSWRAGYVMDFCIPRAVADGQKSDIIGDG